jgi:glycosyltransferase involved in cell wall biosynthesis
MVSQHSFAEEVVLRRNVFELLDAGFDVDVICSAGITGVRRGLDDRPGLRVHWIPVKHRRRPFIRYPWEYAVFFLSTLAVASGLASRRRYVAVQVDNLPDFLVFAVVVPRLRGARVVFNMLELTPEMVAARFGAGRLRGLVRLARRIEAAAAGWADHVIVVSEECRQRVLQRGVPAEKMTVVVNTTTTPPDGNGGGSQAGQVAERPFVVTHTTLLERYGVHVAIQAFASLQRRWPELTLRVIGDGEERAALVRLAAELGLQDRVVFTGFLPWTETIAQVKRAVLGIVAVMADGYGELLLPTKLLEYARFGVPAACSRLPVIEHYFPEDSLAYFAAGDVAELAAQLDALLSDPTRAREQARRAEEVARMLGWERVRGDYLKALGLSTPVGEPMTMASALEERPA